MQNWYYRLGEDQKGPLSQEQIQALIGADVINTHTPVWNDTLEGWKPLFQTELRSLLGAEVATPPPFTAAAAVPGPAPAPQAARSHKIYDTTALSWVVRIILGVNIIYDGALTVPMFRNLKAFEERRQFALNVVESDFVAVVGFILVAAVAAAMLTWMYQKTSTLWATKGPQSITPAGAVYWWFVPVVWFWKPAEAVVNIVRGGNGSMIWVPVWWGAFWLSLLAAALFNEVTPPASAITTEHAMNVYVVWNTVTFGLDALACVAAGRFVRSLMKK